MSSAQFCFSYKTLAFAVVATLVGCGGAAPERVAIRGGVQYGDDMMKSGRIHFVPTGATKGPSATAVIRDGFYEFDRENGPIVGTHRVEIETQPELSFALDDEAAYAAAATKLPPGRSVLPKEALPATYNRQSTLQATIERGGQTMFDFRLERPDIASRN